MATVEPPASHRDEVGLLVDLADRRYATVAVLLTPGAPVVAYLSGSVTVMLYVHVVLGVFWFGLDLFFKFVPGPSLDASPPEAAGAVNRRLVPKIVVAEPLSVGVVGSGVGPASLLGYFGEPTVWLYGALGVAAPMLIVGFGPPHRITTSLVVELDGEPPDGERVRAPLDRAMRWGLLESGFTIPIAAMMVGLRGPL